AARIPKWGWTGWGMFERNKKDARYQKNHVVGMFIRLSCASSYNDGDFIISVQRYKDFLRNANDCCKNFLLTRKSLCLSPTETGFH
ncbi:MAG: hypothetical protein SPE85_10660, partial [Prevotella sp.]|nr:hypothetical protein [Prevotella sp.]